MSDANNPIKTNLTQSWWPKWLTANCLAGMLRGIEKEGLRMQSDGFLAQTPHPKALGSKLTHPYITTDYSESLLELITEPKSSPIAALNMLRELHVLVYQSLPEGELMWPLSMPCMLSSDDEDIPLASYGDSNIGRLKTLYRQGLGVRYGRRMQTIAGLHYNLSFGDDFFSTWQDSLKNDMDQSLKNGSNKSEHTKSLTDFKNEKYLGLIRNFKRMSSLIVYLTGASPSVCPCFLTGRDHDLSLLHNKTYYKPQATSLRMGKLGYTNSVQDQLDIRYNTLPEYIDGIRAAINTPFTRFSELGIDDDAGNPIQINDHILQIENEYYSPIRPKQIAQSGETPSHALASRGIAYVEFRAIDLDPYSDIGIRLHTACFLEVFALYCILLDSPDLLPTEDDLLTENLESVVNYGRDPNLTIKTTTDNIHFGTWMQQHIKAMLPLAGLLDATHGCNDYRSAVTLMLGMAAYPGSTLSAQVLADTDRLGSTWQLGFDLAKKHQATMNEQTLSPKTRANYEMMAEKSWLQQFDLEKSERSAPNPQTFYDYVQQYR